MERTYRALVARTALPVHCDNKGIRLLGQTGSINLHLIGIRTGVISAFPFIIVFILRGRRRVEEPALCWVPLDLIWVTERKIGKPDFTEHGFLERRPDEGVELTMSTRQGGKEDSDRLIVELVGEDNLSAMLNHRLVISCVNSTSYREG